MNGAGDRIVVGANLNDGNGVILDMQESLIGMVLMDTSRSRYRWRGCR
ncbi:MAG: hypothetical protein CM15mP65_22400 [Crocinitomicaceae bacterium]|nr:MAG: hypothetical protein CM15mP65_22400 [Crocinitomicaceae bacterium]